MASNSPEEKFHGNESDDDDDDVMGGPWVYYDQRSPNSNLRYCKPLVDLAIDSYNQHHSTNYRVVDLIRVIAVGCAGFYFYMKFTANILGDADADAITFIAEVYDGIQEARVYSVRIVAEDANLPVDVLRL